MLLPTPTSNRSLPFNFGQFDTVVDGLEYAARGDTGYNFYSVRGKLIDRLSYRDLRDQAMTLARRLSNLGLPRGARVIMVAETMSYFHRFFFACQYAGLVPVPVPVPISLGGKEAYVHRLRRMIEAADVSLAVASTDTIGLLRAATAELRLDFVATPDAFDRLPEADGLEPVRPDESCYIQYSSGSTSAPKGVVVSQRAITSNARAIIVHGLKVREGDRCTSWLPLYHDMGLVGFCITPMLTQVSVDYLSTIDFARRSLTWLQLISDNRGTLAFSPSFGYDLCVRRASNGAGAGAAFDLSSWRVAGVGGDMVRADVLERFAEKFETHQFDRTAFLPSYGLAESTLAVSVSALDEEVRTDVIDLQLYEETGAAVPANGSKRTRSFVVCGQPMPDHDLEVRDRDGALLSDRHVGRLMIKGPSVTNGYYRDPEQTQRMLSDDGWLDTGDLGYTLDGSVIVTGRSKDLIICNGRNIWPQDIEWAVERLPDIRGGDVAAFSVDDDDGERVVVVVQCRLRDPAKREQLRREVATMVRMCAGIDCEVTLVGHHSLPMTSSGKLSRAAAKENYLSGVYQSATMLAQAAAAGG